MSEIFLNDILGLKEEDLNKVKIKFNLSQKHSWDSLKLFKESPRTLLIGNFHNVEEGIKKDGKVKRGIKYFRENEIVIGLAEIKNDSWLLFDISKITKDHNKIKYDGKSDELFYYYDHECLVEYEKYFGRLIVEYHKSSRCAILKGNHINEFRVKEILPGRYNDDDFPGYDKVNISWKDLAKKIENKSWKTALENQKGVYLITDTKEGKRYVGSAYGKDMILGRWKDYINNGHGGNKKLKELDFDYIKQHFRYSILEIFKSTTDDDTIIARENWWKDVLLTGNEKYGYNAN